VVARLKKGQGSTRRIAHVFTTMSDTLITTLDQRKIISCREVAKLLGVDRSTVQKYARKGIIPGAYQATGKWGAWKFKRHELEKWWADLTEKNECRKLSSPPLISAKRYRVAR
jgi:excisionase family DNA binding protein